MVGKVDSVTEEHEVPAKGGFLKGATPGGTQFITSLVYTHTDGKKLTVQETDPQLEIAEAKAVVKLKELYRETYPEPKVRIVRSLEVDFSV